MKKVAFSIIILSILSISAFADKRAVWYLVAKNGGSVIAQFDYQIDCEAHARASGGSNICVAGVVDK